jgi:hypothetical protein
MTAVQQRTFSLLSFGAADQAMDRFWQMGPDWVVLCLALLAMLAVVVWYVIDKIRPKPAKKEPLASQWLSKYREMHSQGVLSDEEFRTIKTTLNKQLQDELKRNEEED